MLAEMYDFYFHFLMTTTEASSVGCIDFRDGGGV
jgi:hypothetical protein